MFSCSKSNPFNAIAVVASALSACAACLSPVAIATEIAKPLSAAIERTPYLERLTKERDALRPLVRTATAREFLDSVDSLPRFTPRKIFLQQNLRRFYSPQRYEAAKPEEREGLQEREIGEERYFSTFYGSPLAYVRALELTHAHGLSSLANTKLLDYGYGAIGAPRLMATAGANVVGVDVDPYLAAIYHAPGDTGVIKATAGRNGSLALVDGRFPNDAKVREQIGIGFDLILSKNTLKKGFVTPEKLRRPNETPMIEMGMPAIDFLKGFASVLKPGGLFVIYNIGSAQRQDSYAYAADIRSPFTKDEFEAAGFTVIELNKSDDEAVRAMGDVLGWSQQDMGDLKTNLFAMYTVLRKK